MILKEKNFEDILIKKDFYIICAQTQNEDKESDRIHQIPLNLMENFRIINFFAPNLKNIVNSYFYLLGFDTEEEKMNELVYKFILFINIVNTGKISPFYLSTSQFNEQILKYYIKLNTYQNLRCLFKISLKTLLQIFHKCEEISTKLKGKKMKPSEILFYAVDFVFAGKVSTSFSQLIKTLFRSIFVNNEGVLPENEVNFQTNCIQNYNKQITQYLNLNNLNQNQSLLSHIENFNSCLQSGTTFLIYGKPSSYKSSLIKAVAYLNSLEKGYIFY